MQIASYVVALFYSRYAHPISQLGCGLNDSVGLLHNYKPNINANAFIRLFHDYQTNGGGEELTKKRSKFLVIKTVQGIWIICELTDNQEIKIHPK